MKKILLIEDNKANTILVERILEPHGYALVHAADGETGIQKAIEDRPDLVLIDLGLPDIDGSTVLALLKQVPELQNVPLVAVTAWPAEVVGEMSKQYGFDAVIHKPIDVKQFPHQVSYFLGG